MTGWRHQGQAAFNTNYKETRDEGNEVLFSSLDTFFQWLSSDSWSVLFILTAILKP
jgi:hypothetical protein